MIYNDEQDKFLLKDYQGNIEEQNVKFGCCFVPTTYVLGKAQEYADLLSDDYSKRAIYKEG